MTLLLYAIAEENGVEPRPNGIDGSPVWDVAAEGLTAFVGTAPSAISADPDTLMAYEDAVETLMGERTVLPARFGTVLDDTEGVRRLLLERRDRLVPSLQRVRGAVEFGIRAEWDDGVAPAARRPTGPHAGIDYMLERLELRRRARDIADAIDAAVGDLARERACRILPRPQHPVSIAYLVPRPDVDDFMDRYRQLEAVITGARLVCTGPWPPYSFVAPEQSADPEHA